MVMPGVTMRNAFENLSDPGARTALSVCHAMSIAMTVVLPAPVAILSARRSSSGFASRLRASMSRQRCAYCRFVFATSISQIRVSTAST